MWNLFMEDIERYFTRLEREKGISTLQRLKKVFSENSLWILLTFRSEQWLRENFRVPLIRQIALLIIKCVRSIVFLLHGTHINKRARIGGGFKIIHFGSIWIGPTTIGRHCDISQEVTIGLGGRGEFRGIPEIGDNVFIGPGAKLFGKIKIGNGVAVGSNAVITKSIPDNSVVVGNPGRIVSNEGSAEHFEYNEEDKLFFD